jgi:hypothetical protein
VAALRACRRVNAHRAMLYKGVHLQH